MAYRRQVVGAAPLGREAGRPLALRRVAPGMQRQERDLRRREAVAQRVVEVEVLQRVGADIRLGALRRLALLGRHQLGRDLGGEDRVERVAHVRRELASN